MNHLKGNCFGSSGVRRNKRVKGGKWHITSAALSCTSPVGLTFVNDTRWNQLAVLIPLPHLQPLHFPPALQPYCTRQECPAWHRSATTCASSLESLYGHKAAFAQHLEWSRLWLAPRCALHSNCFSYTRPPHTASLLYRAVLYHLTDYQRIKPLDMHWYADNLTSEVPCLQFTRMLELPRSILEVEYRRSNMLHGMTDSAHLLQLLQRDPGMKHLPDEEHTYEYQTDLSNKSEHQRGGGDTLVLGLNHQNTYPPVLFWGMVQWLWHFTEVLGDGKNCVFFK